MAKHLNKVIDIENNTLAILHIEDMFVILQCVFHGIRLLRLRRIGCRETTNFFLPSPVLLFRPLPGSNRHDLQLIMQKLLAMAVSTVMTKLMIVFHVSFFIALKF